MDKTQVEWVCVCTKGLIDSCCARSRVVVVQLMVGLERLRQHIQDMHSDAQSTTMVLDANMMFEDGHDKPEKMSPTQQPITDEASWIWTPS